MSTTQNHDSSTPADPACKCAAQIANLQARLVALELYIGTAYLQPNLSKAEMLQIQEEGSQARAVAALDRRERIGEKC